MSLPEDLCRKTICHVDGTARISQAPYPALRGIEVNGLHKVEPCPGNPIVELRLPVFVGLVQEVVWYFMSLRDFLEDLFRARLPPKIAQDLKDRREVADELRNAFNFLLEKFHTCPRVLQEIPTNTPDG
jgi:hypothetical protein